MNSSERITSVCLLILTFIAVAFVLALTKGVLIPFTMALFIATIYAPIMTYFEKKLKLPKIPVLLLSFMAFIIFFSVLTILIVNSIDTFIVGADQYKAQLHDASIQLEKTIQQFGFSIETNQIQNAVKKLPLLNFIKGITSSMLSFASNTFLVTIFALFLLTSESASEHKIQVLEEIKRNTAKYIGTKILSSSATSILVYAVLALFGVELAFMFAILTFLLNFIPNVGSIIAVIITVPIILLQFGLSIHLVSILVLLGLIQLIIGNIIEPKFMGESMGLHPVTILLFLTFWGFIWGIPGMFLSVPITATLKIILSKFEITQGLSDLLAGKIRLKV